MLRETHRLSAPAILALAAAVAVVRGTPAGEWKVVKTLSDHKGGVNGLAFSPDGKLLASASSDSKVGLWDAATGKRVVLLKGHKGRVFCVTFSPDGKVIASGGERVIVTWDAVKHTDRGIRYDFPTGYDLPPDRGDSPDPNVLSIAYSPDGDRLLAAGYAIEKRRNSFGYALGSLYAVYSKCLIFRTDSGRVIHDVRAAEMFEYPAQAAPSPDWRVLVRWSGSGLQLADPTAPEAAPRGIPTRGESRFEAVPLGARVGFSPDGEDIRAFSISNPEHSLRLWKVDRRRLDLEEQTPPWRPADVAKVTTAAFSPDAKTLAAAVSFAEEGREGKGGVPALKLLEYRAGKLNEVRELATDHARAITAIAFAPDGKTMATGCQGGYITLWKLAGK